MSYLKIKFTYNQVNVQQFANQNLISFAKTFAVVGSNANEIMQNLAGEITVNFRSFSGILVIGTEPSLYSCSIVIFNDEKIDARLALGEILHVPALSGQENTSFCELIKCFDNQQQHDSWHIEYYGYTGGKKERSRESLLTIGNGFMGIRGALTETKASNNNYPGTYVAGMYNRLVSKIAGRQITNEDFVNIPNAMFITIQVDGAEPYCPNKHLVIELKRDLNLKTGVLNTYLIGQDNLGHQFEIIVSKVANMNDPHECGISYSIKPLNFSKNINLISEIDGQVTNCGVDRYNSLSSCHINPVSEQANDNLATLMVVTSQSKVQIVQAASLRLNGDKTTDWSNSTVLGKTISKVSLYAKEHEVYTLEKNIALFTSLETTGNLITRAQELVCRQRCFADIVTDSTKAWNRLWHVADIQITGDMLSQKLARMHIYHLFIAGSPHNNKLDASVTARGLHGEAYRGHIFWDEIFILPFYSINFPKTARQFLMYRYRRLDAARVYAKSNGFRGAMFPWQSGSDGSEETQRIHLNPESGQWGDDHSSLQRHVSLAIAYNIWLYVHVTDDQEFMQLYGIEMILEIARFWSSKTTLNIVTGKYFIDEVMGPNEFHEAYTGASKAGLKNNAYTNVMVAWLFDLVPKLLAALKDAAIVKKKINFADSELMLINDIKRKLTIELNDEGIISQHEGFFNLKELNWNKYASKYNNVHRVDRLLKAEGKSANDYKVIKQADTLMTFYNIHEKDINKIIINMGYSLPVDYFARNFNYYLARTSHGSTLSRIVHAQLAQLIGDSKLSWSLYRDALGSDYNDIQEGSTAEGVHTGVMAASLMVALSAYAGIDLRNSYLCINPCMPQAWNKMAFNIQFKGTNYNLAINHRYIKISVNANSCILVKNNKYKLLSKQCTTIHYQAPKKVLGLIFDLDGVIVDTAKFHYIAWSNMAKRVAVDIDRQFDEQLKGISRIEALEKILTYGGKAAIYDEQEKQALADEKNQTYLTLLEQLTPQHILPGVLAILDQADALGIKCAIASTSKNAPYVLEKLQLKERFAHIVDSSVLIKGKPDPEIFTRAAQAIDISPAEVICFEDAQAGIDSIRSANMFAVGVSENKLLHNTHVLVSSLDCFKLSNYLSGC